MKGIDQEKSLPQTKVSYMEHSHLTTSYLVFVISKTILGQENFEERSESSSFEKPYF